LPSRPDRRRACVIAAVLLFGVAAARRAEAYTWMIREGESRCVSCHVDPSGGGLLTAFGREQGADVLRTRFSGKDDEEAIARSGKFFWGAFDTPDWLLLGGSFRPAMLITRASADGQTNTSRTGIIMQADLRAGIRAGGWRASATVGAISNNSYASIAGNVVSREHWVGYAFDSDTYTVRAGRMNLPYGLRIIEHNLWVRASTRTDINDQQQHGAAFTFDNRRVRAEVMAILGNYQISPDAYRERGYSAYAEVLLAPAVAIGASSLITHAAKDIVLAVPNTRQAHGLFARAVPWTPLVLMAEGDLTVDDPTGAPHAVGVATMLQADVEPLHGLHLIATGETWRPGGTLTSTFYGGFGAVDWFIGWHIDLRVDAGWQSMPFGNMTVDATSILLQFHLYL
jgi:hypothetical protein